MTYKSGETPQKNDEVLGQIDGAPARGRVLAVRENGDVLVTRRAAYSGPKKPLVAEHREVPAADMSLVYRPVDQYATVGAAAAPAGAAKKPSRSKTK